MMTDEIVYLLFGWIVETGRGSKEKYIEYEITGQI